MGGPPRFIVDGAGRRAQRFENAAHPIPLPDPVAQIPVKPAKRGIPGWLWALLALIAVGILAFLFFTGAFGATAADDGRAETSTTAPAN